MATNNVQFSDSDLLEMKQFYRNELDATLRKLEHLRNVLARLEGNHPSVEVTISSSSSVAVTTPAPVIGNYIDEEEDFDETEPKRKRKKKRGPKPVWGNFILKRLRQLERPITYQELTEDAMAFMKLDESKLESTRLAILNSSFRLRKVHKKIDTHHVKGRKAVYVGLSKWFEEGELSSSYVKRIK